MFLEGLVTIFCIGGYACGPATKAYYESYPELKQQVKGVTNKVKKKVGQPATIVLPAVASLVADNTLRINLAKNWTVNKKPDSLVLIYGFTF